jgi:hypothetical protein
LRLSVAEKVGSVSSRMSAVSDFRFIDEARQSALSFRGGRYACALLAALYRLFAIVLLLGSLVYLRIFQHDLSMATFSSQTLVLLSISLTTLHCVSLSRSCSSGFRTETEDSSAIASQPADASVLESGNRARFALDDVDNDDDDLNSSIVPASWNPDDGNSKNLPAEIRDQPLDSAENTEFSPPFRDRNPSCLQKFCFKLPEFVENLFLLAFANTIFLDVVWWVLLRPRADQKTFWKVSTYLMHGPLNFVIAFVELWISTIIARRAVVILGLIYIVAYFLFTLIFHQVNGEWLYFFLNLRFSRNWFIILGLFSWYGACHALIFLVVTVRDRIRRKAELVNKSHRERALFER